MLIANPIYDVVFKYMMEDARVAKIFLSAIMGKELVDIQFLPQELSGVKSSDKETLSLNLTIYRLDFSAKVKDKNGQEELIIIEVQKSKLYGDIMRFRRYLGKQYMNESYYKDIKDKKGKTIKMGVPIYAIYFLGTTLDGYENHPVVRIKMEMYDNATGARIEKEDGFIKSLYHEGTIVNISALKGERREDLEILLSIFDQENRTDDMHILNIQEQDFPSQFHPIIRRLKKAVEVKEVRDVMDIEDDFVKEINEYEHRVTRQTALLEEERRQKEEAQRKQEEAQLKQEEAQRKQEEAQRKQEEAIKLLLKSGVSPENISEQLDLPLDYVLMLCNC